MTELEELERLKEAVAALPQRILQAKEQEDERIAREIHDDLGQSLATLKILIQAAEQESTQDNKTAKISFSRIIDYLNTIIEKTRHLASQLRPSNLQILGLNAALKTLVDDFRCKKDLKIQFTCSRLGRLIFEGDRINLYRILQEALTNIVRHAKASQVVISIKKNRNNLHICINDNGRGFKIFTKVNQGSLGLGLSTMQERVRLLGGKFTIDTQQGKGTDIKILIPVTVEQKN